jgi:DNA polymerase
MEIIGIDFETYYDKDYSLTKLTTEQYIRDPRFEVIMVGIRMPDENKFILTGTHEEIKWQLDRIDWSQYAVVAHNAMFDAAILSWVFGIVPKAWLDTLGMSRAMFGGRGNSLAALAKRYNMEEKGTEVHNMMGRTRNSLAPYEFQQYAKYCLHDVDLCYDLFHLMANGWYDLESIDKRDNYPMQELQLIDVILRMYIEPVLRLNKDKLVQHLADVQKRKEDLLSASSASKDELMSNPKFAGILESFGVSPPMKISPTTGKAAFAFAKTDPGMKTLLEHPDERVQAVVAARMGVKSTLEETRTLRFIDIADRGNFPVPLKYSAARTHRLGGCLVADSVVTVYNPTQGQLQKRIVDVLLEDLVWDGEEFVSHNGVSFSGYSEVISYDGVTGTADHRVFCGDAGAYRQVTLGEAAHSGERIATPRMPLQDDLDTVSCRFRSTAKK